jgi:hypothetical protein
MNGAMKALHYHTSGAVARGEKQAIIGQPAITEPKVRVLAIDAIRCESGWTWNNWHFIQHLPLALCHVKPRAMLRVLRETGIISAPGRLAIEDDGYNITIVARGTRKPLIALEYGAERL